jgi:DNA-binding protein HU-beta
MNKTELAAAIVNAYPEKITKDAATSFVDTFCDVIGDSLKSGENVQITGFGTFKASQRAARDGRNPLTGEDMHFPAVTVVSFSAGKGLKDIVNPKKAKAAAKKAEASKKDVKKTGKKVEEPTTKKQLKKKAK